MTTVFYTEPRGLDEYFLDLRSRCVTDRAAIDWMQKHIESGQLVFTPAMPEICCLQLRGRQDLKLRPKEPGPLLNAADYTVRIRSKAPFSSLPEDRQVIIGPGGRLFYRGYVLTPPHLPGEPVAAIKPEDKPRKSRSDSPIWAAIIIPHIDAFIRANGKFRSQSAAAREVRASMETEKAMTWLKRTKSAPLSDSAITKGVRKRRQDWVLGGVV
jgi:hypothetical protein